MPKAIYEKANKDTLAVLRETMHRYHPEKHTQGLRVAMVMVTPPTDGEGEPTDAALRRNSWRVAADLRLVKLRERVLLPFDVVMQVDAFWWADARPENRIALIDHQLTRLEFKRHENEIVKDDDGRPRLFVRLEDYCVTGFRECVVRHGAASIEYQQIAEFEKKHSQGWFAWAIEDDDGGGGVASVA